jgi:tRNA threonylcarbamoyladenosine biosynthesis protein TsaE
MIEARPGTVEAMEELGREVGRATVPGEVFGLVGGLGAGKTHWTKGFVSGAGCDATVTSPTFGLVHRYDAPDLAVHHFDFYRLASADEALALGWDEYLESGGVVIVEWADRFPGLMPAESRWLQFTVEADGSRQVREVQAL